MSNAVTTFLAWSNTVTYIMRFMILCDRHHKVSPNPIPLQNSNGFAMHEGHFVISFVKYRESHYVTVLDVYVAFDPWPWAFGIRPYSRSWAKFFFYTDLPPGK